MLWIEKGGNQPWTLVVIVEPEARVSVYNKSGQELMTCHCGDGCARLKIVRNLASSLGQFAWRCQAFLGAALLVFLPSHSAALRSASLASHWHFPLLALHSEPATLSSLAKDRSSDASTAVILLLDQRHLVWKSLLSDLARIPSI